jgi:hypothetical protein
VTSSFTLSGGSWNASYPETNLQLLPLSRVARTTNATTPNTSIIATSATPKQAGIVALARHNMSLSATIRVLVWSDAAMSTLVYDSSYINVWAGSVTATDIAGSICTWFHRFAAVGTTVGAIRLDINDTGNTDGYVQAGYLEIASVFEVTYNPDWGMNYGFRWRSQTTEAIGGALYVDRRAKPRVVKGVFKYSPRDEAMAKHFERERQLDLDQPILFVPFPGETTHLNRTVMLARQVDAGLAALTVMGFDSVPFALEEIIG